MFCIKRRFTPTVSAITVALLALTLTSGARANSFPLQVGSPTPSTARAPSSLAVVASLNSGGRGLGIPPLLKPQRFRTRRGPIQWNSAMASWYYDYTGATACGYHAQYGVANKSLPCGTRVTFSYGGRVVTATVDDRGPYVYGRSWDLSQNTAGALHFGGVAPVRYHVK